jgi:hypothetical protein
LLELWFDGWKSENAKFCITYGGRLSDRDQDRQFRPGGFGRRPLGWFLYRHGRDTAPRWWDPASDEYLRPRELEAAYLKRTSMLVAGELEMVDQDEPVWWRIVEPNEPLPIWWPEGFPRD